MTEANDIKWVDAREADGGLLINDEFLGEMIRHANGQWGGSCRRCGVLHRSFIVFPLDVLRSKLVKHVTACRSTAGPRPWVEPGGAA